MNRKHMTPDEEIEFLRDALDHIARIGRATRQHTRRTEWIVERATLALKGKALAAPGGLGGLTEEGAIARKKDGSRYRKLRDRDLLGADFMIANLQGYFREDMDAIVDALPPLPQPQKKEPEEAAP